MNKIPIGISSCLLGEKVRFNGGHTRDDFITKILGNYFDFQPLCPEVAIGMGVPRDPIRLVDVEGEWRAQGIDDPDVDVTRPLRQYVKEVSPLLKQVCGYILKSKSPSCGMERVKVYRPNQRPVNQGVGIFAQRLMEKYPLMPVEEEGRLHDPVLRENFIERVFIYHRWQQLGRMTAGKLVQFHTQHKLIILSHNQADYRRLGQLISNAKKTPISELSQTYIQELMATLKKRANRRNHTNVLNHLQGYLKAVLDKEDKAELLQVIKDYRAGQVPLIVPITLFKHHFRKHPSEYIDQQYYMQPHPAELMLRNFI